MPVSRQKWPYQQVADGIAAKIAGGEEGYREGDQLPTLQVLTAEWETSHETTHRAMMLLRSRRLITTIPRVGSFVGAPREIPGPQQLLGGLRFPAADRIKVTYSDVVPCPEYVVPILGVAQAGPGGAAWVIRREQVTYKPDGQPVMLMVMWFPGNFAELAPALVSDAPLPPGDELALLAAAGRPVSRWTISWEARQILDDGREGPLMRLEPGDYVQAITCTWGDEQDVTGYIEYVLQPGLVTVAEGTLEDLA
jgi:hypothetical protein